MAFAEFTSMAYQVFCEREFSKWGFLKSNFPFVFIPKQFGGQVKLRYVIAKIYWRTCLNLTQQGWTLPQCGSNKNWKNVFGKTLFYQFTEIFIREKLNVYLRCMEKDLQNINVNVIKSYNIFFKKLPWYNWLWGLQGILRDMSMWIHLRLDECK